MVIDAESAILELEQRLARAWVQKDRAFIDQLLAADWTVTDPAGRILSKHEVLEKTFGSEDRQIDAMTVDAVRVRLLGDVAVATRRHSNSGYQRRFREARNGRTELAPGRSAPTSGFSRREKHFQRVKLPVKGLDGT
jgi:hypothetical protein